MIFPTFTDLPIAHHILHVLRRLQGRRGRKRWRWRAPPRPSRGSWWATSQCLEAMNRDRLKSVHQVWWVLLLLLLISSASTCLQNSPNLEQRLNQSLCVISQGNFTSSLLNSHEKPKSLSDSVATDWQTMRRIHATFTNRQLSPLIIAEAKSRKHFFGKDKTANVLEFSGLSCS